MRALERPSGQGSGMEGFGALRGFGRGMPETVLRVLRGLGV